MPHAAFSFPLSMRTALAAALVGLPLGLLAPAASAGSIHPSSGATRAGAAAGAGPAASRAAAASPAPATPNGLAATPPMGWNDWYAFQCNLNERLVEQTADAMVASGMRDAGYNYVNLDDCWLSTQRDVNGALQADRAKFPDGIKAVADYVHARGLKLGIYEDVGTQTCAGYPGSYGHVQQDAGTFASWGIDFVKADWCNVPFGDFPGMSQKQVAQKLYTQYSDALRATGRPMVFSICEWDPSLQPWTWAPGISNMWRTNGDYGDSWPNILANLDQEAALAQYAGPGHWNDPDILQAGLGGMSTAEDQAHFSAWAMLAAPLLAGNDLRSMSPATKAILTNRDVIAIDQDPLGAQATRVSHSAGADVWTKPLANGDRAVMLLNRSADPLTISTTAGAAGLPNAGAYSVRDLWAHTTTESAGQIDASVPGHSAALFRVAPLKDQVDQYPPLINVSVVPDVPAQAGSPDRIVTAGSDVSVPATLRNDGRSAITDARLSLQAPSGWTISGNPVSTPALATGHSVSGQWHVSVPRDTKPGHYVITGTGTYLWSDGTRSGTTTGAGGFQVFVPPSGTAIPQAGMTAATDSTQGDFGWCCLASRAIDGNPDTLWHSQWDPYQPPPHEITINLGADYNVSGLTYLPRQDGNYNGVITSYAVSISSDGTNFTQLTAGSWDDDTTTKSASFPSRQARYVRLTALAGDGGFASAAEINVFATPSS